MKTIIKTNIKDNINVTCKESVTQIRDFLLQKGSFILFTRIDTSNKESLAILSKSSIKMVKQQ